MRLPRHEEGANGTDDFEHHETCITATETQAVYSWWFKDLDDLDRSSIPAYDADAEYGSCLHNTTVTIRNLPDQGALFSNVDLNGIRKVRHNLYQVGTLIIIIALPVTSNPNVQSKTFSRLLYSSVQRSPFMGPNTVTDCEAILEKNCSLSLRRIHLDV